jgi:hypothetical protein
MWHRELAHAGGDCEQHLPSGAQAAAVEIINSGNCGRITITVFPETFSGPRSSLDAASGYLTTAISYLDTI